MPEAKGCLKPGDGPTRARALATAGALPVVGMVSLGCAKNTVDSERVLGMLADAGFPVTPDPELADLVIVNTCAFIAPAREETEETLRDLARSRLVVAVGCYAERYGGTDGEETDATRRLPGVAAFVPFDAFDELPRVCASLAGASAPEGAARFDEAPRLRTGSPATAYLKIAEGCSNRCSYCAVPGIRGPLRSSPIEKLVDEAESLAGLGARELCVIAQDTASYGTDLYGEPRLAELLKKLCGVKKLRWVRLLYVHPAHLVGKLRDEVLDVMAGEEKLVRYLDLPCQHVSDRVLAAMGRRHDGAHLRGLVARIRERVPGVTLRTSIIAGFPGESEAEFRDLLDFVRETEFDHLGAFCYSREEGTSAAGMPGQVPAKTARARRSRLMRVQQRIAFARLDARVGGTETTMLELPASISSEGIARDAAAAWTARTEREAPEVDGHLLVDGPADAADPAGAASGGACRTAARPGDLVEVRVSARAGYDLVARPVRHMSGPRGS